MKKFTFAACIAIAAAAFTSCGNGTPNANLKNDIDTLSYAMGMAQSDGLKEYLVERQGIDTAYIDEFIKVHSAHFRASRVQGMTALSSMNS